MSPRRDKEVQERERERPRKPNGQDSRETRMTSESDAATETTPSD